MTTPTVPVGTRMPPDLIRKVDAWAARQRRPVARSEAIRLLLADRLRDE